MLSLLRQFLLPYSGWPWLSYLGLALLAIAVAAGLFSPRVGFGTAVASYVFLLGLPFAIAPKVWRGLISARQLLLTPGFARKATLAAFLFTLLQAVYLNIFATLYGLPGPHLRQTALMFINGSVYVAIMQYAITTSWAVGAMSFLPVFYVASLLLVLQGSLRSILGNDHVLWLTIAIMAGWILTWRLVGVSHQFRGQHSSVSQIHDPQNPRLPLALWLLGDSEARGPAAISLLLGYPATFGSRLRILAYTVFFGPVVATVLLGLLRFGQDWDWGFHPTALEILLGSSLYPATFAAFHQVDWVARLRLVWLRGSLQRPRMWSLLERQMLTNTAVLVGICCALAGSGLVFSQLAPHWLLHFPLLILSFNMFYIYYVVCARTDNWSQGQGLLITAVCSTLIYFAWYLALRRNQPLWLYALELAALAGAWYLRPIARRKLETIDWLKVKPRRLAKLAN